MPEPSADLAKRSALEMILARPALFVGVGYFGEQIFQTAGRNDVYEQHIRPDGTAVCTCPARGTCWHRTAALLALRRMMGQPCGEDGCVRVQTAAGAAVESAPDPTLHRL